MTQGSLGFRINGRKLRIESSVVSVNNWLTSLANTRSSRGDFYGFIVNISNGHLVIAPAQQGDKNAVFYQVQSATIRLPGVPKKVMSFDIDQTNLSEPLVVIPEKTKTITMSPTAPNIKINRMAKVALARSLNNLTEEIEFATERWEKRERKSARLENEEKKGKTPVQFRQATILPEDTTLSNLIEELNDMVVQNGIVLGLTEENTVYASVRIGG